MRVMVSLRRNIGLTLAVEMVPFRRLQGTDVDADCGVCAAITEWPGGSRVIAYSSTFWHDRDLTASVTPGPNRRQIMTWAMSLNRSSAVAVVVLVIMATS